MQQLLNHEVMGFETYQQNRANIRSEMITQRKLRSVQLTENIRVIFENKQTVRYQIEEVLYAQRSSCRTEVDEQIATYAHLLPTYNSLKATLMLEYPEEQQARDTLALLKDIESTVYLQIASGERIWPVCNQDIDGLRIISPVHYLSFKLEDSQLKSLQSNDRFAIGIAHGCLTIGAQPLSANLCQQLLADLQKQALS